MAQQNVSLKEFISKTMVLHAKIAQSHHCFWFLAEYSQKELQVIRIPPHSDMKTSDET